MLQDAFLILEKKKQKKMAELLSQHQNLREVFWDMNKEKRIGDKRDFLVSPLSLFTCVGEDNFDFVS